MSVDDIIRERGPQVLDALRGIASEYGDDVFFWAIDKIKARRSRKRRKAASTAIDELRELTEKLEAENKRIRESMGEGQP